MLRATAEEGDAFQVLGVWIPLFSFSPSPVEACRRCSTQTRVALKTLVLTSCSRARVGLKANATNTRGRPRKHLHRGSGKLQRWKVSTHIYYYQHFFNTSLFQLIFPLSRLHLGIFFFFNFPTLAQLVAIFREVFSVQTRQSMTYFHVKFNQIVIFYFILKIFHLDVDSSGILQFQ